MDTLFKMWDPGYGDVARTKNLELVRQYLENNPMEMEYTEIKTVAARAEDTVGADLFDFADINEALEYAMVCPNPLILVLEKGRHEIDSTNVKPENVTPEMGNTGLSVFQLKNRYTILYGGGDNDISETLVTFKSFDTPARGRIIFSVFNAFFGMYNLEFNYDPDDIVTDENFYDRQTFIYSTHSKIYLGCDYVEWPPNVELPDGSGGTYTPQAEGYIKAPKFSEINGEFSNFEVYVDGEMGFYTDAFYLGPHNTLFGEGTFRYLNGGRPNEFLRARFISTVYLSGEAIDWPQAVPEYEGNLNLTEFKFINCNSVPKDKLIKANNPFTITKIKNNTPIRIEQASGPTADRPTNFKVGMSYFDTDLGKPIYWNGTEWVDSTGTAV